MKNVDSRHGISRPGLLDRLELWFCTSKRVDGLWIGAQKSDIESLSYIEAALSLIKTYDRLRYDRIISDLERIWVRVQTDSIASFNPPLSACEIDPRFILDGETGPELIASTIVHEAAHARLIRCGVSYDEKLRSRVEAICIRREKAFAAKLPSGEVVRERAERTSKRTAQPGYLTDKAFEDRYTEGSIEVLRYLGTPEWIIRVAVSIRAARMSVRRLFRRPGSDAHH